MGMPAAKQGDRITATDQHTVLIPSPTGTVPQVESLPFTGIIDSTLSATVSVDGRPAAVVGSMATNTPPHVPIGGTFAVEPTNKGVITSGSGTVFFDGLPAARSADRAITCNDPVPAEVGTVVAESTVLIGG